MSNRNSPKDFGPFGLEDSPMGGKRLVAYHLTKPGVYVVSSGECPDAHQ